MTDDHLPYVYLVVFAVIVLADIVWLYASDKP